MLDIDDFKRVNDVHGHGTGDLVLVELADLLQGIVRVSDVVCRLGGEEFGVIMTSATPADGPRARRPDRRARSRRRRSTRPGRLSVSIGIAQGPEHAMNPRELVACAEIAMMTAKTRGKDQVVLFEEEAGERPAPAARRARRALDRPPEDAPEPRGQAQPAERRPRDRRRRSSTSCECSSTTTTAASTWSTATTSFPSRGAATSTPTRTRASRRSTCRIGEGITGRVAETGESILLSNALDCDYRRDDPGHATTSTSR